MHVYLRYLACHACFTIITANEKKFVLCIRCSNGNLRLNHLSQLGGIQKYEMRVFFSSVLVLWLNHNLGFISMKMIEYPEKLIPEV